MADWFVRLSDVAPGRNGHTNHRRCSIDGAQRANRWPNHAELEPGKVYPLNITMHLTSWVFFPPGHRIRMAISNALWPMVLPTPYSMTTSLELRKQRFASFIAGRARAGNPLRFPAFQPPQASEERKDITSVGYPWPREWTLRAPRRSELQKAAVHWKGKAETNYPWGKETDFESLIYNVDDAHPES